MFKHIVASSIVVFYILLLAVYTTYHIYVSDFFMKLYGVPSKFSTGIVCTELIGTVLRTFHIVYIIGWLIIEMIKQKRITIFLRHNFDVLERYNLENSQVPGKYIELGKTLGCVENTKFKIWASNLVITGVFMLDFYFATINMSPEIIVLLSLNCVSYLFHIIVTFIFAYSSFITNDLC